MDARQRRHIVEHLHGLAAASFAVLAVFLAFSVPHAVGLLARGRVTGSSLVPLALFALFAWGALREAQRWQKCRAATPA